MPKWIFSALVAGICLLLVAVSGSVARGADAPSRSPFAGPPPAEDQSSAAAPWLDRVLETQRAIHRKLGSTLRLLKQETSLEGLALVLGLSFLYGVVHAAGPGHGKVVVSTYLLANKTQLRAGILLSVLGSLFQAVSAILMVLALAVIAGLAGLETLRSAQYVEMASFLALAALGLWLAWGAFVEARAHGLLPVLSNRRVAISAAPAAHAPGHDGHHHHHDHDHHHSHHAHHHGAPDLAAIEGAQTLRDRLLVALAVGLRPCSGALLVLLLTLSQGLFWLGVISAFVMAVGTALTVSVIASLTIGARATALRLFGRERTSLLWLAAGARLAAGLAIALIGLALFVGAASSPARPII